MFRSLPASSGLASEVTSMQSQVAVGMYHASHVSLVFLSVLCICVFDAFMYGCVTW